MLKPVLRTGLILSSSLLASACLIMPPPNAGGQTPSGGSAPGAQESSAAMPATATPEAPASPAETKAPVPSSIEVRNSCSKTVQLFIGEKPKFGSGTKTSIGSNTTTTFPRKPDGTAVVWIIDDKENGIQSVNVTTTTKKVEIGSSCTDISAR